jgi:hypothetical protein
MKLLMIAALMLALVECGHYTYYAKEGPSSQGKAKDFSECKQASMQNYSTGMLLSTSGVATSGMAMSGSESDEALMGACMRARGYTQFETERRRMIAEGNALDEHERELNVQRRVLNEQRRVLLEQRAAVMADAGRVWPQRYELEAADYEVRLAAFNKQVATLDKQKADFLKRVDDFVKRS